MGMSRHKTVEEALQYVANHPEQGIDNDTLDVPAWELIGRVLFHIANNPDRRVRGSMGRATRAQKMIMNRISGRRRPGTHPAQVGADPIDFVDLTKPVLE